MFLELKRIYLRHGRIVWAAAVFMSSFILYAATAPHTIFTNDNPEFVTAAATAGIPHPSGYPLYVILTWFVAKVPIGTLAYRVNLFSALCAAASLVMGYFIIDKIIRELEPENRQQGWLSAVMILPLAVTGIFWYQAIVAKTYSLNLFLTLFAVWLAVKCYDERRPRDFCLFALVAGLGLSNHPMFALSLPFIALLLVRRGVWTKKLFFACGGLFLLGILPYAYIPIRSAMHPLLDSARVVDWPSFWRFVTRAQYGDLGGGDLVNKIKFLSFFALGAWDQFSWLLLFALVGLVVVLKSNKRWFCVLSAVLVFNPLGIIDLRNLPFSYAEAAVNAPYYLPSYAAMFIFCIIGLWFCFHLFKKFTTPLIVVVCMAGIIVFFQTNFSSNDLRAFKFIDNLSRETLLSLPKNAVFIVSVGNAAADTIAFSYTYQRYVGRLRPDVAIVSLPYDIPQVDDQAVIAAFSKKNVSDRRAALYAYALKTYPGRPIYATFPYYPCAAQRATCSVPTVTPYAYGLSGAIEASLPLLAISTNDVNILRHDVFGQQVLADYYYQQADFLLGAHEPARAANAVEQAISESPISGSQEFVDYQQLRSRLNEKQPTHSDKVLP